MNNLTSWIKGLINSGNIDKFYHSRIWKNKVNEILQRDNFECQECKREGLVTTKLDNKKLDVHHKKELKKFPELALDNDNLETVCIRHHNILDNKVHISNQKFINEERW